MKFVWPGSGRINGIPLYLQHVVSSQSFTSKKAMKRIGNRSGNIKKTLLAGYSLLATGNGAMTILQPFKVSFEFSFEICKYAGPLLQTGALSKRFW